SFDAERTNDTGDVAAEVGPVVRRFGLVAAAMATHVDGEHVTPREVCDYLVPAAGVEAGSVGQEYRLPFAGPLVHLQVDTVDLEPRFLRFRHGEQCRVRSSCCPVVSECSPSLWRGCARARVVRCTVPSRGLR